MELNFDKMNGLVPAIIQDNYTQTSYKTTTLRKFLCWAS